MRMPRYEHRSRLRCQPQLTAAVVLAGVSSCRRDGVVEAETSAQVVH